MQVQDVMLFWQKQQSVHLNLQFQNQIILVGHITKHLFVIVYT